MKLNIGCGDFKLDGYVGVDAVQRGAADVIADAGALPFPDNSVEEIMAIHVWEHFWLTELEDISREWQRVLIPGGLLVLELPCFEKIINNAYWDLRKGRWDPRLHVYGMNGDPRAHATKDATMLHKYTWRSSEISEKLKSMGWVNIKVVGAVHHHQCRDMRVVAQKR